MNVNSSILLDAAAPFRGSAESGMGSPILDATGTQDVGEQFESVFVSMLLKEMRESSSEDGMFAGDSADVYGGLFDTFLGQHIASQSSLGLAEMVNQQISPKSGAGNQSDAGSQSGTAPPAPEALTEG
jgi:Rod binding domain-containing protein